MDLKFRWAPLEESWSNFCANYCSFVARNPWTFIIMPTILTAILSTGILLHLKVVYGVDYLFSPINAPWKAEHDVFFLNWASDNNRFYPNRDSTLRDGLYVILTAKDDGNILEQQNVKEAIEIVDFIFNIHVNLPDKVKLVPENYLVKTPKHDFFHKLHDSDINGIDFMNLTANTRKFRFADICLRLRGECFAHQPARIMDTIFELQNKDYSNITFAMFNTKNYSLKTVNLSLLLGGVGKSEGAAKAWILSFLFQQTDNFLKKEFISEFIRLIHQNSTKSQFQYLNIYYFHHGTFDEELANNIEKIMPRFLITFIILVVFTVFCTLIFVRIEKWPFFVIDWVLSKPLIGVTGVLTTLMAISSSMGLLLWLNVTYVEMCNVMPFLSLTIGIDDTFLILAAWRATPRELPTEKRVAEAMRHAAVSITVTSATDALAFLIGAMAPLPAVIYFCLYSAAAICFIFVYFMTIFVATLSIQGRCETQNRNALLNIECICSKIENTDLFTRIFNTGNRGNSCKNGNDVMSTNSNSLNTISCILSFPSSTPLSTVSFSSSLRSLTALLKTRKAFSQSRENKNKKYLGKTNAFWYEHFFMNLYVPFICRPVVQIVTLLSFLFYTAVTAYGVTKVVVGFDLANILAYDSPSRRFLELRAKYFTDELSHVDVAVLSPPAMINFTQRSNFLQIVQEFGTVKNCVAIEKAIDFWYFDWKNYMEKIGFGNLLSATFDVNEFVLNESLHLFHASDDKAKYDLIFGDGEVQMFRFSVAMNLTNLATNSQILSCSKAFRALCEKHSIFRITTYSPLWNLADQYEIIWPQTMQDLYISIGVMMAVSLVAIPHPICAVAVGSSIASVGFGVIGFMAWWDVALDATSMITMAMSVGFSVDFAAHITYAYTRQSAYSSANLVSTEQMRLGRALACVGWPITQSSISVILGISTLATVDTYIIQSCFKTVILVICLGVFHALLYLPLALMHLHILMNRLTSMLEKNREGD